MALDLPTNSKEVTQKLQTDFQRNIPESNPKLRNSWINAFLIAIANRIFDFYLTLNNAFKQLFPDTATGDFLTNLHATIWGLARNAATPSSGNIIVTGLAGIIIPDTSLLQNSRGDSYETSIAVVISTNVTVLDSLTRSGSTVTGVIKGGHNFTSSTPITISGSIEAGYQGTFDVIPLNATDFTYQIATFPATPALGEAISSADYAITPVKSQSFGVDTVQSPDEKLTFTTSIPGVDTDARADQAGLTGGTDLETDEQLRLRLLSRIAKPITQFNTGQVEFEARKVSGVTRLFIRSLTPVPGFVTIYFTRDNDVNIIPDANSVVAVNDVLQEIRPVAIPSENLIVAAPTPVQTSFLFRSISPDTGPMRTAIEDNLNLFFRNNTTVDISVLEETYKAVIVSSIASTGDVLNNFQLDSPIGDISVIDGELATLDLVTFP